MRARPIFLTTALLGVFLMFCQNSVKTVHQSNIGPQNFICYSWQETDTSLALLNGSKVVWKLNYNTQRGKPYFSPLNTLDGRNLVWLRPDDHPWHYGLWFSWKYINKKNFWEEDRITKLSEGQATLDSMTKTLGKDFMAEFKMHISYSPNGRSKVLREKRTMKMYPPDNNGNYFIDWFMEWTAQKDTVVLDREIPKKLGGPEWGGYAGLSYRAAPEMSQHVYRHANDWETNEELVGYGEKAKWMDLSGNLPESKETSGLTIFNYPENTADEVAWYIYKDGNFAFFNASPLFNRPITLSPGVTMKHNYRILVHGKALSREEIDVHYQNFIDADDQEN